MLKCVSQRLGLCLQGATCAHPLVREHIHSLTITGLCVSHRDVALCVNIKNILCKAEGARGVGQRKQLLVECELKVPEGHSCGVPERILDRICNLSHHRNCLHSSRPHLTVRTGTEQAKKYKHERQTRAKRRRHQNSLEAAPHPERASVSASPRGRKKVVNILVHDDVWGKSQRGGE
jgi:hypothetical protein